MDFVAQIFIRTPWWVYVLFVYLVTRGLRARKPGETTPFKLALIPALFTGMGIMEITRQYGVNVQSVVPWIVTFAVGILLGMRIMAGVALTVVPERGVIQRPADYTVLPLILLGFCTKYVFGVLGAVSPNLAHDAVYRLVEIGAYGFFAGIFVGKFVIYMRRFLAAKPGTIASA